MQAHEAIDKLASCADVLRAAGVTALHLFGSTAVNEARPDSDIDLFIDHGEDSPFSLFDLVGVKLLIEDRLGINVDVTTRGGLHPMMRDEIESLAIRVF